MNSYYYVFFLPAHYDLYRYCLQCCSINRRKELFDIGLRGGHSASRVLGGPHWTTR